MTNSTIPERKTQADLKQVVQSPNQYLSLEAEAAAHMKENGFIFNGSFETTGEAIKFAGRDGEKEKTEWYKADVQSFADGKVRLLVTYNSFHISLNADENYVFKSKASPPLNKSDREAEKARVVKMQQERTLKGAKDEEARKAKAKTARERFKKASQTGTSLYLERKRIGAHGIRFEKKLEETLLLIPMQDENGIIQALQEIYETKRIIGEGKKPRDKNFTNTSGGLFFVIGTIVNGQLIRVSEGYATAASCYESSECSIPHVVSFSDKAYSKVIPILRKLYPDSHIQICADGSKDPEKKSSGILEAEKAVKSVENCSFIYPIFKQGKDKDDNGDCYKDFNDLMIVEGKEEAARQLTNAMEQQPKSGQESTGTATITVQNELKKLASTLLEKEEPCANFSTKDLPRILREYIDSLCIQSDAHPIMTTTATISSLSGIIKKKIFIPKGEYFQKLYANVWLLNLYKSGGFKSTAMENGASIAREQSKDAIRKIKQIEDELRGGKKNKEDIVIKRLEDSLKDVIFPNKITAEGLLEHLGNGHAGVILTGEFGAWLQNMQNGHNTDLKGIFTELYDVPPAYRYLTKTQGDNILEEPFFSICGVSTLTWVKENLNPNDVSSGFFARFLLFTPPHSDDIPPALPRNKERPSKHAEQMIRDLLDNMDNKYEYTLSPSAKHVFEVAHSSLYSMTKSYSDKCQQILDPYLKRWSPYILKISMIMRLFEDHTSKEISDTAINSAMALLIPAIKSTALLFEGELGESDQQRKCRLIFDWLCNRIKNDKLPTWAALITSKILNGGYIEYKYPMQTLVEGGRVNEIQKPLKKDWLYVPVDK